MKTRVARQLQTLERSTQALLNSVATWTPGQLLAHPADNAWSALEVIAHLCQVEKSFIHMVRKSALGPASVSLAERLRARVVITVMYLPVRVKVPGGTPVQAKPDCRQTLQEARGEWLAIRQRLRALLDRKTDLPRNRGVFRHPVSGWMTLELAVAFLASHCRHHLYQVNRLAKRP